MIVSTLRERNLWSPQSLACGAVCFVALLVPESRDIPARPGFFPIPLYIVLALPAFLPTLGAAWGKLERGGIVATGTRYEIIWASLSLVGSVLIFKGVAAGSEMLPADPRIPLAMGLMVTGACLHLGPSSGFLLAILATLSITLVPLGTEPPTWCLMMSGADLSVKVLIFGGAAASGLLRRIATRLPLLQRPSILRPA